MYAFLNTWYGVRVLDRGRRCGGTGIEVALRHNQLANAIPAAFFRLLGERLSKLAIEGSHLTALDPAVGHLVRCLEINLSNNLIGGNIPHEIKKLRCLRILNLGHVSGACWPPPAPLTSPARSTTEPPHRPRPARFQGIAPPDGPRRVQEPPGGRRAETLAVRHAEPDRP